MVISFSGKSRSGKDTAAKYLIENHGFVKLSIAGKLKELCAKAFGIPFSYFEEQGIKDEESNIIDAYEHVDGDLYYGKAYSHRELLINIGNAARDILGSSVWIKAVENTIISNPDVKYVVTDVRFPVELEILKKLGTVIRLEREDSAKRYDPGETLLDNCSFQYTVYNNFTIEELNQQIDMIYQEVYIV